MAKYRFLLIILLFFPVFIYASSVEFFPGARGELSISLSNYSINPGDSIDIHVEGRTFGVHEFDGRLSVNMGDGTTQLTDKPGFFDFGNSCGRSQVDNVCIGDLSHTYDKPGNYSVVVEMCVYTVAPPFPCLTEMAQVVVIGPSVITVCIPDGCNGICPDLCTVNDDPDCGCVDGNACCGMGCDISNDKDCVGGLNKYDNPILANNIIEFIWQVLYFIFTAVIYLSVLFILIGAYVMVTSGGNMTKVELGKKIVIFTLIGLAISLVSRGIMALLLKFLSD